MQIPAEIRCAADYELAAQRCIPTPAFEYIAGGAGADRAARANRSAFDEWCIWPRLLRDVSQGSTRTELLGRTRSHPLLAAPVAFHHLVHERAEIDSARGADAADAVFVASTLSNCTLEDIARAAPGEKWFQLYFQPERAATLGLMRRAEASGYAAIVVTLDAAIQSPSRRALQAGFRMPEDCVAANLREYASQAPPALGPDESRIFQDLMRFAPTWKDLDWLLTQAKLPVLVKGVLHADDAVQLRERGVAGVIVSNHGGRTLDSAPPSLDALPAVRAAVREDFPVLFDSGIRSGEDVFKALALGANAVLIGRLQLYALSVAGALGVAHMLRLLREELAACMAAAGCASIGDVHRATLTSTRG